MGKITDVDKAQQALDRAARNARSGPADVRAGRFVLRDVGTGRFKDAMKDKAGAVPRKKRYL